MAALPWRWSIAIHRRIGRGMCRALGKRRRIVERNLEICFPTLTASEIADLAMRNFESLSVAMAEIAFAWFRRADAQPPFRAAGVEHIERAQAAGRGVILYAGHFTTLEFCGYLAKRVVPAMSFMYRPRKNALLDYVQSRGRLRISDVSFANDNVRSLVRLLRERGVIWYAPDQAHGGSGAVLLPFFGEPAMTSTATARIARLSGAAVVPFFFRRADDGTGYVLRFEPALDSIPSGDDEADTLKLVTVIERFVTECPAQYLWTHRRFKGRGAQWRDAYAPDSAAATVRETPPN